MQAPALEAADEPTAADSVAFSLVDELFSANKVDAEQAETLRNKYERLFTAHAAAAERNRKLDKQLRAAHNDVLRDQIQLEKTKTEEAETVMRVKLLENEKVGLQFELEQCEETDAAVTFELNELIKTHEELKTLLENLQAENQRLVGPVLADLQTEIQKLETDIQQNTEATEKESARKAEALRRLTALQTQCQARNAERKELEEQLESARIEPRRLTKGIETVSKVLANMEADLKELDGRKQSQAAELQQSQARHVELEQLHKELRSRLSEQHSVLHQRQEALEALRSHLEREKARQHELATKKMELELRRREVVSSLRHSNDAHSLASKEYDSMKRLLKKKHGHLNTVRALIPPLQEQLHDQQMIVASFKAEQDRIDRETSSLTDEVDTLMAQFLQQEGIENQERTRLQQLLNELDEVEAEAVRWSHEEKRQAKQIAVLSIQRDLKAREAVRAEQAAKDTRQQVKMKELVVLDQTKRYNEINNRLKEFTALYDVIKTERNRHVNLIQSSQQVLAELREKINILQSEVEILKNESSAKDRALTKERAVHVSAVTQRDQLRMEVNDLMTTYRERQNAVEQQVQEIDKLNSIINRLERDMLALKSKYEKAVEERNAAGLQLIDRNDELCILYEKSNIQQETLRKGEIALQELEQHVRIIRLSVQEYRRQVSVMSWRLPEFEKLQARAKELEQALNEERERTQQLSTQLEDPGNAERWNNLGGEDMDVEEMMLKISVLQKRLDEKREQILQRELVIEEIAMSIEKMKLQMAENKDTSIASAATVNQLQGRIRETTKRMLATVSELSMYQATALKLEEEKQRLGKALEEAQWRVAHDQAPSEDAVKEWHRIQRAQTQRLDSSVELDDGFRVIQSDGFVRTTAELRPTAYIPDEIGLPKPYGALAPFKPTSPGSNMRHIRPPKPQEIII